MNALATPAAARPAVAAPVKLRAVGPGDAGLLGDFIRGLSPQAKRLLEAFGERCVGEARSVAVDDAPQTHEFGLSVADDRRRRGLGSALLERLLCLARRAGVRWLRGDVLRENLPMLTLARRLGFAVTRHPDDATLVRVLRATTQPCWIRD